MVVKRKRMPSKPVQAGTAPPYISFSLFIQLLDALSLYGQRYGDLPQQLDKVFWNDFFNNSQSPQIMAALRYLHLIEPLTHKLMPMLRRLVSLEERRAALQDVLRGHYSGVLSLLERAEVTRKEVDLRFEAVFHVRDSTRRKGVSFLLAAARYADLPVAPGLSRGVDDAADNASPDETVAEDNPPLAVTLPLLTQGGEYIERPTDSQDTHGASYALQEGFDMSPGQLMNAGEGGSSAASMEVLDVITALSDDLYVHPDWPDDVRLLWRQTIRYNAEVLKRIITRTIQGDKTTGARPANNGYMRP